jgi:hypothetical protein
MIRTLRALFLARLFREKLLLVVFVVFGLLWWLSAFSTRLKGFTTQSRRTGAILTEQQLWLDNRKRIDADAAKAAAKFDRTKTLDGNRLLGEVANLARTAGIQERNTSAMLGPPETNGQFTVNTLNFTASRTEWGALSKFYLALEQRSPYISIYSMQVAVSSGNEVLLDVTLKLSALEFSH